jgi:hypothetical protein
VSFHASSSLSIVLGALVLGAIVGLASAAMSRMMYGFEDLFERLPIHWMWWPALGGLGVGIGGLFFPRGLGVGYDNIAELLRGSAPVGFIVGILICKSLMWAFSLGSGTSGGVLAPLLMIGGALGALAGHLMHATPESQALWALLGMGAMLSGSLGVPLTAILFSVELTHFWPAMLPLTLACISSYLVAVLILPRSILTEKLSRRGYHLSREYGVDPLELVLVGELILPANSSAASDGEVSRPYTFADQTTRSAAELMATEGMTSLQVLDRASGKVLGSVTALDLLKGRRQAAVREQERLRLFGTAILPKTPKSLSHLHVE